MSLAESAPPTPALGMPIPEAASPSPAGHSELELARLRLHLTNTLLGAIGTDDPVRALVWQLATMCQGSALIYDADGSIAISVGEAPARLIWNEVSASSEAQQRLEIGKWFGLSRRIALSGEIHVIAIASRQPTILDHASDELLDAAERILSTIYGLQYGAHLRERRDNDQLLGALEDGITPSREHRFWNRMAQFHFASYRPLLALNLSPINHGAAGEEDVRSVISHARTTELPLLAGLRRSGLSVAASVTAVIPAGPPAERMIERLGATYSVGVSAPVATLTQIPNAVREARTAREIASRRIGREQPGATVRMDQVDLATWLRTRVPRAALSAQSDRALGGIPKDDALRSTLVMFLATGQHVARTAQHLFIHQNTVRYRLARIEEELGAPLSDVTVLTNLTLALYEDVLEAAWLYRNGEKS